MDDTTAGAATASPRTTAPHRNGLLDALRGIAVAAVVAYHVWPEQVPGGFLGVDVFFVLSGFLITGALTAQLDVSSGRVLAQFWARRVRRLAPALLVVLVTATAAAGIVGGSPAARLRPQIVGALTFTSNWYQAGSGQSYFDRFEPPMFQHLWSLAVEEQLYLVWPLVLLVLVRFVPRHRTRAVVVAALAAASATGMAALYVPGHDPSRLYFGTDTHGFSALVGALAALSTGLLPRALEHRHRLRIAAGILVAMLGALTVLVTSFAVMDDTSALAYRGGILAVDLCSAVLVLGCLELDHARLARTLPLRVLRWLGTRSYGLYLWHWPVLVLIERIWPTTPTTPSTEVLARGLLMVGSSLLLASVSWRYVEQPVLNGTWRAQLRNSAVATRGLRRRVVPAIAGAALACGLSAYAVATSPTQGSVQARITTGLQALQSAGVEPSPTRHGPGPTTATPITPPPPSGGNITVLGDSVTVASAPALLARWHGIEIDAQVGAQLWDTPTEVARLRARNELRPYVVVALGTNGDVAGGVLAAIVRAAGPGHWFVFVTAHGDRSWIPPVDSKIRGFATTTKGVALADWDAAAPQVHDFADDGIHPGPQGGGVFATIVARALARLHAEP